MALGETVRSYKTISDTEVLVTRKEFDSAEVGKYIGVGDTGKKSIRDIQMVGSANEMETLKKLLKKHNYTEGVLN